MSLRVKWVLACGLLAGVVLVAGMTCENDYYATSDCSTGYSRFLLIPVLLALGGWFLLPALISSDGEESDRTQETNADQLATIARLRDEGKLSEGEYEAEKARILGAGDG